MKMTTKMKRFCDEYLKDFNATQAALRAGYSEKSAKAIGCENLTKPAIRAYIDRRMRQHESEDVATQEEALKYLTSVMRGESVSEDLAVEGIGKGFSKARGIEKSPYEAERIKATEILLRAYGVFTRERIELEKEKLALEREKLEFAKMKGGQTAENEDNYGVVVLSPVLEDDADG